MSITLRPYQAQAVEAVWNHLRTREDNPCVVLPTASGKTPVMATLARQAIKDWSGKVLILAHVKELLTQSAEKLSIIAPDVSFGVYSAGLGSRDLGYPCTIAGVQSVYERAREIGHVDLVMIDEAHRIPESGDGMYRTLLQWLKEVNPAVRLIGMTATPFRLSSGNICGPENLLNRICYEVGIRPLIVQGYLSPLTSKVTRDAKVDTSNLHVRAGEFVQEEVDALMGDDTLIAMACVEIVEKTQDRRSVLVFASSVAHAQRIARMLGESVGDELVGTVFGETSSDERARTIRRFKSHEIKYIVNVNVLSEGFDAPAVDCVCLLRPTMSPGLYCQQVGRGFRLAEGKKNCLVLDFAGNIFLHGPVDRMLITEQRGRAPADPWKECPSCQEVVPRACDVCPDCGMKFEKPKREERGIGHGDKAAEDEILSGPETVQEVIYSKHEKKVNPKHKPPTLEVDYYCGLIQTPSEYICFEHVGFAQQKAAAWWRARSSEPVPATIDQALEIIHSKGIKEPKRIILRSERGYLKPEKYLDLEHKTPLQVAGAEENFEM